MNSLKTYFKYFLAWTCFTYSIPSFCYEVFLDHPLGPISFEVPDQWKAARDFFGIPMVVLGPKTREDRPGIYIVPLGRSGTLVDETKFQHSQLDYVSGVEHWARVNNSIVTKFYPYEVISWKNGFRGHQFGFDYQRDGKELEEHSYYLTCLSHLYQIRTIMPKKSSARFAHQINEAMQSMNCNGVKHD